MKDKERLRDRIVEGIRDMFYIWAKEMKMTVKDEGVLIFFLLVPLAYPLLYGWIYNNEVVREVPVAIVDNSRTQLSRTFIRQYDASPHVRVAYHCNNLEEVKQLMGEEKVHGILYFPSDFSAKLNEGRQSSVSIYCDMSILLYYKNIYQTAVELSLETGDKVKITHSGNYTQRDDELTLKPLDYEEVPIFNPYGGYAAFLLPGVLVLILHQTLLLGIGMSAGTARENNRYRELVPISGHYRGLFRIVLGKSLCYWMIYAAMSAYVLLLVPHIFHLVNLITFPAFIGLIMPFLLATIFFGMMISCVVRYRENIMLIIVFTSVPLLFLSGVSWPQSSMPGMWQSVAALFPSTYGIRGYVRLSTMGATLTDIQAECQALWIQTAVYFLAACAVYRHQIIHARQNAGKTLRKMKDKATLAKVHKMTVDDE